MLSKQNSSVRLNCLTFVFNSYSLGVDKCNCASEADGLGRAFAIDISVLTLIHEVSLFLNVSAALSNIYTFAVTAAVTLQCHWLVDGLYAGCLQVNSEYLQSICNKLFSSRIRETADFSRPGTAGRLLRQSVVASQPSSALSHSYHLWTFASVLCA